MSDKRIKYANISALEYNPVGAFDIVNVSALPSSVLISVIKLKFALIEEFVVVREVFDIESLLKSRVPLVLFAKKVPESEASRPSLSVPPDKYIVLAVNVSFTIPLPAEKLTLFCVTELLKITSPV